VYRFFEQLIDPLRAPLDDEPPELTRAFFWHYLVPVWPVIAMAMALTGIAAVAEVLMFQFLGQLLDWMANSEPQNFLSEHGWGLLFMVIVTAVIRPIALLATRATMSFALTPGISNRTRLLNHRYVLRQSMKYFQNDFAGRIGRGVDDAHLSGGHFVVV